MDFLIETGGTPTRPVVGVVGDLDAARVDELAAAVAALPPARVTIIDLRRLGFIDSTGLRCLIDIDRNADGAVVFLVPRAGIVRRAIELAHIERALTIREYDPGLDRDTS